MKRMRKRKKVNRHSETKKDSAFFPAVQTKLSVGKADDVFEKEADSVADRVVNNSDKGGAIQKMGVEGAKIQEKPIDSITPVQKMGAEEEKEPTIQKQDEQEEQPVQKMEEKEDESVQKQEEPEEEEALQMQEVPEEEAVQKQEEPEEEAVQKAEEEEEPQAKLSGKQPKGGGVEARLKSSKGQGQKMSKTTRREMEAGFGADFSDVNIHTGSEAQAMSDELGAQAFTSGKDVYFNDGKYDPDSKEGKHLLAHELTHTIQQKGKDMKKVQRSVITNQSEDLEADKFRGDFILEKAHDDERLLRKGSQGFHVTRLQHGLTSLGFALPRFGVDGIFGSETESAVVSFQNAFDLGVDGIVGGETMGTLDDIHSGKELGTGCCVDLFELPQKNLQFNINSDHMIATTFCAKSNFKITANANWVTPHDAKHYHIIMLTAPGSVRKPGRRFDVGRTETQNVQILKKDCVEFKILIKVINPSASPNLKGEISLTH